MSRAGLYACRFRRMVAFLLLIWKAVMYLQLFIDSAASNHQLNQDKHRSKSVLSRVIIRDMDEVFDDDPYEPEHKEIIKELSLESGVVFGERTWRKVRNNRPQDWEPGEWNFPIDGNGNF